MIDVRESVGVVSFLVRAQPRARLSEIMGEWQGALRVRLAAPAAEGLANEALRRLLAENLGVPLGAVKIVQGQRNRSKRIQIAGATAAQVRALLSPRRRKKATKSAGVIPPIDSIQDELRAAGLDGWLFYDFHHRDPIAAQVLRLEQNGLGTRRWFYLIPARGTPSKLIHRIESRALDGLPGRKLLYAGQEELRKNLARLMNRARKVAMQYSPRNAIPYVSMVDAGTVELVRAQGCKVVSSADLVQKFEACWTAGQYRSHLDAGRIIDRIIQEAFARAAARVRANAPLREYELQQWILKRFRTAGITTAEPPIVAVGAHTADPHYEPHLQGSALIRRGSLLLLDIWGKLNRQGSVYYDITWVGYLGTQVPAKYAKIFSAACRARDSAVAFVQQSLARGRTVQGWQVDRAARDVIRKAGYAKFFVHRTGHNIGQEVHGNGANMDSLETHDSRTVLPQTCFSVEPGIYLSEFGVRTEVNVYVDGKQARVTGPVQTGILPLLA